MKGRGMFRSALVVLCFVLLTCLAFGCQPTPTQTPCPNCLPASFQALPAVGATVAGNVAPDGTPVQLDLPEDRHQKNKGGSDGAGLCVFTSIGHSADWQDVDALKDFRDWMTKHPGGGYPSKVRDMIARKCREAGVPEPAYLQYQGGDLEILKLACKTGRMPGVTYCVSPAGRYNGQRIAHMVSLVHADDKWFACLDNNFPRSIEWMTPTEFKRTFTGNGGGWAVVLLRPGPPPAPKN